MSNSTKVKCTFCDKIIFKENCKKVISGILKEKLFLINYYKFLVSDYIIKYICPKCIENMKESRISKLVNLFNFSNKCFYCNSKREIKLNIFLIGSPLKSYRLNPNEFIVIYNNLPIRKDICPSCQNKKHN